MFVCLHCVGDGFSVAVMSCLVKRCYSKSMSYQAGNRDPALFCRNLRLRFCVPQMSEAARLRCRRFSFLMRAVGEFIEL